MPNNDDGPKPPPQPQVQQLSKPNEKSVYLWSKPVETQGSPTAEGGQQEDGQAQQQRRNPTIANAVATIKKEDFSNVVQTPCARQGFVAGIAFGAAFGGLSLVIRGSVLRSANWAVGMFVAGSVGSYEYCQYQRRAERLQMKRNIEVVTGKRREAEENKVEEQARLIKEERDRKDAERRWYKFW